MTKVITALFLLLCSTLFGQSPYEQGMQNALALWSEGKTDESVALFERIAAAEKDNWLPNYYVALVNTTSAFNSPDKNQMNAMLNKAQTALDVELKKQPNHPELLVMQAMIHTAWIVFDPATNGMTLSGKVMELYARAETIAPENPRVVLSKVEFEMGSARYFGADVKPLCAKVEKAIELFASFKPETAFHPNWGLDRAQVILAECK